MKKILYFLLLFTTYILRAQDIDLSKLQMGSYMYNQYVYNPAAGGMYETDFSANMVARIQWAGVSGAPVTSYGWADHRFRKNSMSAGLAYTYDQFGSNKYFDVGGNYTYIIRLNNKLKLNLGLRAGMVNYEWTPGKTFDAGDVLAVPVSIQYPKFGTGAQLYTRKYYLSLGLPDIAPFNNSQFASDREQSFFAKNRSIILMAGYRLKISDGFSLYPNGKIYYYYSASKARNDIGPFQLAGKAVPFRADASLIAEITDYFWAGASYATTGSASIMAGSYMSSRIRFMYAYEFMTSAKNINQSLDIHEITLMLQLDDLFARKNKSTIEE
ncbi:MAG: PorP/SprF family type IX secretion system membrane protein [Cytophagales bacterium]|nr:PorP/SprF family type IX secretion system membrane protein [Cytophagales bacterium]